MAKIINNFMTAICFLKEQAKTRPLLFKKAGQNGLLVRITLVHCFLKKQAKTAFWSGLRSSTAF
jgi:hypothetical protein